VTPNRRIGKATLYKVDLKKPLVNMLREYETKLSLQIAEQKKAKMQRPVPKHPVKALEELKIEAKESVYEKRGSGGRSKACGQETRKVI